MQQMKTKKRKEKKEAKTNLKNSKYITVNHEDLNMKAYTMNLRNTIDACNRINL